MIENILESIESIRNLTFNHSNDESLVDKLNEIDTLIKSDVKIRENIPDEFYSELSIKLKQSLENENWNVASLTMKCIKNSAACHRHELKASESLICSFLINFLNANVHDRCLKNFESFEREKFTFFQFNFQYIFNLIKGSREALDLYLNEWLDICFRLMIDSELRQDLFNLCCMITSYSCLENSTDKKNERLIENNFQKYVPNCQVFYGFLARFERELEINKLNIYNVRENDMLNWSFKFLDHFFDHFYFDLFLGSQTECSNFIQSSDFDKIQFGILNFLCNKIDDLYHLSSQNTQVFSHLNSMKYFTEINLRFLVDFYQYLVKKNFNLIKNVEHEPKLKNVIDLNLKKIKILLVCVSDILTMNENSLSECVIKSNIKYVQQEENIFDLTCNLFKEIHFNKKLNELFDVSNNKSSSLNMKCELVRLIGILVYENQTNQKKMVENDLLNIISNNLDVDMNNPFIREWSIVTLKHILACLDAK
jgi:hypothetical protein